MAKEYKAGDRYYLPVCVKEIDSGYLFSVRVAFNNGDGNNEGHNAIKNEPDLLLTAEEITEKRLGRAFSECYPTFEELKAKVAELEEHREQATRRIQLLEKENVIHRKTICNRDKEIAGLEAERDDLKSQVGKNLAEIQDLNAEIHFLKAKRDKQKAEYDELKGRYDELDSVNHEQAEKIRKLDKALTDLKQRNDKLQDENTNLTFQLEDQPEEEPTKTVHAVLNDGTGYNFFKCTKASFDNYADFSVLKIYRGEEYIAGFLRGDKPGNIAYWWTE